MKQPLKLFAVVVIGFATLASFAAKTQKPPDPVAASAAMPTPLTAETVVVMPPPPDPATNQLSIAWDTPNNTNISFRVTVTDSNSYNATNISKTNGATVVKLAEHAQYWVSVTEISSFLSSSNGLPVMVTNESTASALSFMVPMNSPIIILTNDKARVYLSSSTNPAALWSARSPTNGLWNKELIGVSNSVVFREFATTNPALYFKVK